LYYFVGRGPFYVKRKPREPKPKKEKENVQNFEEETRMSGFEGILLFITLALRKIDPAE